MSWPKSIIPRAFFWAPKQESRTMLNVVPNEHCFVRDSEGDIKQMYFHAKDDGMDRPVKVWIEVPGRDTKAARRDQPMLRPPAGMRSPEYLAACQLARPAYMYRVSQL
jgi:hypothetical protein